MLADRASSRKLIAFSMLTTGLAGFAFAAFPLSVAIHGFWGITCSLTFWGAMIKTTRYWAPAAKQGKAFGILESGRGIAELAGSTALLAVFAGLGDGKLGLARVIVLLSVIDILLAVMAWFTLHDSGQDDRRPGENGPKIELRQMLIVLKMPAETRERLQEVIRRAKAV